MRVLPDLISPGLIEKVHINQFFKPYPEVKPVLAKLVSRGWRIGVLSNFELASIEPSLKAVGLLSYIDVAFSSTLIGARKPEAKAYLSITKALGVEPVDCLYFDDQMTLVEGARKLGMNAYLVDRKSAYHQLNNHTISDLTAVIDIIDDSLHSSAASGNETQHGECFC